MKDYPAIAQIIEHTDECLENWYRNAKEEYGIIGKGITSYNVQESEIVISYVENGELKTWSMAFYPEYIENGLNWVFNCWQELA